MSDTADTAQVIIRPPIAWALTVIAGLALNWLMPLPFLPAAVPARWVGGVVFVLALVLLAWAISTITRSGSNVWGRPKRFTWTKDLSNRTEFFTSKAALSVRSSTGPTQTSCRVRAHLGSLG